MRLFAVRRMSLGGAMLVVALPLTHLNDDASAQSVTEGKNAPVVTLPTRRAPDAPPTAPPDVPAAAERIAAVTVSAIVRRTPLNASPQREPRTISRTVDRVHIAEKGREWLFERNVRDPRRVSAFLIEHMSRTIVMYQESDLRMSLGIRGWSDVVGIGFDVAHLSDYQGGEKVRTVSGVAFRHYAAKHTGAARDVWWNAEQLLAADFTSSDGEGSTRFSIARIHNGVDASLLRPPESRFPAYRTFNLADWLEHR